MVFTIFHISAFKIGFKQSNSKENNFGKAPSLPSAFFALDRKLF